MVLVTVEDEEEADELVLAEVALRVIVEQRRTSRLIAAMWTIVHERFMVIAHQIVAYRHL
jgi:hypothetical protein